LHEDSCIPDQYKLQAKINQLNIETMNSVNSVAGRSSIDMENLFRMKEEYIFVFGKNYSSLI